MAHPGVRTNLQGLTSRFENVTTTLHEVPAGFEGQVDNYIRAHRSNRYRDLKRETSRLELQDLYLSDPRLPSQSGAITGDMAAAGYRHAVYVEIPAWAVRLRLLRPNNYTLTDRGKVLTRLRPDLVNAIRSFHPTSNPFLISVGERYVYLYCLLDGDGDLLRRILSEFFQRQMPLSRREIGQLAAEALQDFLTSRLGRLTGGRERDLKEKIKVTIQAIKNQKGSGMGPSESVATPRTEPLVDCGVLERTSGTSYDYRLRGAATVFVRALADTSSIDVFLERYLATHTAELSEGSQASYPAANALRFIADAYSHLRSGLGYCSIREVALLAGALAINEGAGILEIGDAEQAIFNIAREKGRDVRFTKSRQGEIAQVRISPRLLLELVNE